jgi:iron complex outermembrane receptor protein
VLPIGADGNIRISAPFTLVRFTEGYRGNPEFYEQHARAEAVLTWNGLEKHSLRFATGVTSQEESGRESKNFGPGVLDLGSRLCGPGICTVDGRLTDVSGTPNAFIEDQDRDVLYASLQDQWQIANDWNLTAGLRYDDYSDFGSTVNPRVALVWDMHTDLTAKLLYGRAFRAPSFAELFIINNPVALGNPDLDPETTNTYELAFDWRPGFAWRLGLNLFQYEIEDLIDFESTGSAQRAANVGRQEGKGLEFEAEWQALDSLRVVANFATQSAEDKRLDENTARAPEHMAYLRAHWTFAPDWSATGELRWIADRNREPMDPRPPVDDYTLVNLNLEREHIAGRLDLGLRVRNLLDENAREPSPTETVPSGSLIPDDFPLEERSVHLTARVRF